MSGSRQCEKRVRAASEAACTPSRKSGHSAPQDDFLQSPPCRGVGSEAMDGRRKGETASIHATPVSAGLGADSTDQGRTSRPKSLRAVLGHSVPARDTAESEGARTEGESTSQPWDLTGSVCRAQARRKGKEDKGEKDTSLRPNFEDAHDPESKIEGAGREREGLYRLRAGNALHPDARNGADGDVQEGEILGASSRRRRRNVA